MRSFSEVFASLFLPLYADGVDSRLHLSWQASLLRIQTPQPLHATVSIHSKLSIVCLSSAYSQTSSPIHPQLGPQIPLQGTDLAQPTFELPCPFLCLCPYSHPCLKYLLRCKQGTRLGPLQTPRHPGSTSSTRQLTSPSACLQITPTSGNTHTVYSRPQSCGYNTVP